VRFHRNRGNTAALDGRELGWGISLRARKPVSQDQESLPPKQVTATASADGAVVNISLASNHLKLWLFPTVISITPDDAMALSIELQKAAIDARLFGIRAAGA
jgi:hypothetical protein